MSSTFYLLAGVIASSLLIKSRDIILLLIGLLSFFAWYDAVVNLWGVLFLALFFSITYLHYNYKKVRWVSLAFMLGLTLAMMLHKLPGFNNHLALDQVQISALSKPYTMYFNFDKCIAALILFALSGLVKSEKVPNKTALLQTLNILLCCIVVIILPSLLIGYVKFDIKIPSILGIWIFNNFLFVCFAEEVLFRGIIQKKLQQDLKLNPYLAITITSVLFGLAHFKGGITYVILATICGMFYGYAYFKTNRILCSMLVHFGLNLVHFIFFTYPMLVKS